MTKSRSGMVTKVITHLLTEILPVLVIKSAFSLLPLGRYLLPITTQNRYQPTDSSWKFFFTTTSRNVTIVRYRISLVTILLLDLVMIHWIHWIQRKSFRKNSIISTVNLYLLGWLEFDFSEKYLCQIWLKDDRRLSQVKSWDKRLEDPQCFYCQVKWH